MKQILLICLLLTTFFAKAQNISIGISNPTKARLEVHGGSNTPAIFGGDGSGVSLYRDFPGIGFNNFLRANFRPLATGFSATQRFDHAYGNFFIQLFPSANAGDVLSAGLRAFNLSIDGMATIACDGFSGTLNVGRFPGLIPTAQFFGSQHHSMFYTGADENTYIRAGKDNGTVFINDIPSGRIVLGPSVGIGTATPGIGVEVRQAAGGACFALIEPSYLNKWEYRVHSSTGDLQMLANNVYVSRYNASNGNYVTLSDKRFKTAIEPLSPVLQKIRQLQTVTYYMQSDTAQRQKTIGFIAQDVKKLFPQLVTVHNKPVKGYGHISDLHTMDYSGINVLAIQAIKEQQEVIDSQAKLLNELEAELMALEKAIRSTVKK